MKKNSPHHAYRLHIDPQSFICSLWSKTQLNTNHTHIIIPNTFHFQVPHQSSAFSMVRGSDKNELFFFPGATPTSEVDSSLFSEGFYTNVSGPKSLTGPWSNDSENALNRLQDFISRVMKLPFYSTSTTWVLRACTHVVPSTITILITSWQYKAEASCFQVTHFHLRQTNQLLVSQLMPMPITHQRMERAENFIWNLSQSFL